MPRIFVAVPIADEIRSALAAIPKDRALRWVSAGQYHMTLRFLGDITHAEVDKVDAAVSETMRYWQKVAGPISLKVEGLGAFPNRVRPRIVWAGVSGDIAALKNVQAQLENALVRVGFSPEDRPFRPHITVARTRNARPLPSRLQAYDQHVFGTWRVAEMQVIESVLSPSGPRYTVLRQFLLNPGF